jgi:hypothetical protein
VSYTCLRPMLMLSSDDVGIALSFANFGGGEAKPVVEDEAPKGDTHLGTRAEEGGDVDSTAPSPLDPPRGM